MKLVEVKKNLFTVDDSYYLAHCIATDLRMGAGIAVDMQKKFGLRNQIIKQNMNIKNPAVILTGRVFNLITKRKSSGKPTYHSFTETIKGMQVIAEREGIKKIAMPKIGCGLDRLQWGRVRDIIDEVFSETDIEILVCKL